ncbi:hypothetical protein PG993_001642 [Apiospora rasikravindrae]|uniref:Essential protein Yae1 N-terminal domain-containing protein n=1 Tax=Apiospora rasikravindrae TaxID=990691 RepID=A0ABR1UBZ0_9PEZI
MASDPFDDVLNLEDQYYDQGYKLGYDDGFQAGKIEGRSVGLKKGYEKFMEAGRLQSKAVIWANRIPNMQKAAQTKGDAATKMAARSKQSSEHAQSQGPDGSNMANLPLISNSNARLEKNITSLYALVEPGTLSTENTDEAVNDFDDRFKRAQGKLKIVERAIGEESEKPSTEKSTVGPARNEI